jgi:DNA repair ATPase RecN
VVVKVRERLAVSRQGAQKFDMVRFNLRKLNKLEVRKQYQSKILNRFASLQNLYDSKDINRVWENIKDNIKTSAKESLGLYELKQNKPWFGDECSQFLDQREEEVTI